MIPLGTLSDVQYAFIFEHLSCGRQDTLGIWLSIKGTKSLCTQGADVFVGKPDSKVSISYDVSE